MRAPLMGLAACRPVPITERREAGFFGDDHARRALEFGAERDRGGVIEQPTATTHPGDPATP